MDITGEREPRLQVEEGRPFDIGSVHVDWEMESSYLRDIRTVEGRRLLLPVGAKVTLYTGPSVVFMGRVQEDQSVLDLLSSEDADDGEYVDF
jgi:hypothetical protein